MENVIMPEFMELTDGGGRDEFFDDVADMANTLQQAILSAAAPESRTVESESTSPQAE
jgi:hypothetical protein